jgi:hypothetical protein
MIKKTRGTIHGNTIEVTDDLGLPEGEQVEVTIERVTADTKQVAPTMSEGLAKVYSILGERYSSGHTDTAARHNEHQP